MIVQALLLQHSRRDHAGDLDLDQPWSGPRPRLPEKMVARVGDCGARVCVRDDARAPLLIRRREAREK
jgi:hypothetical protein